MRQVPHYLLIGNGRVAKHFRAYFSHLSIPFTTWCRQQSRVDLNLAIANSSHILLLIQDDAIIPFIQTHLQNYSGYIIHCSGSLMTKLAYGAHPLMTFAHELYTHDVYLSIPFIIDNDAPDFSALLPQLPNQHQRLHDADKGKYHAMCVFSGNFSCLLWQQLFDVFQKQFHWPKQLAHPYLKQQMKNLMESPEQALTGPLARQDNKTLQRNLQALQGQPTAVLYQAFIDFYNSINEVNQHERV
jgi:predicted short-subunit dehydrogenase-like oxidoreductase (DUF2520 family)